MLSAQYNRRVSGIVTDSTRTGIPNVKVLIVTDKDTLKAETGQDGKFNVSKVNAERFSIQISAFGYQAIHASYTFTEKETHKRLDAVQLKMSSQMLKEVVINAKPNPIRFMQDTVEYNASAFRVNEGDNVADLLKQFPGLEVDDEYNVKVMDKEMVKLRINGKDFFTNNVKDFIGKLPAGIVSKIQVIDDFGDEANFTGLKMGEPIKMLNIVTKPGMNKGVFGGLSSNGGTNNMIGGNSRLNLWNDNKQSSANISASTSNNGAGRARSFGLGLNHNDKLGKNSKGGFGYDFSNNGTAYGREQVTESITSEGSFINNTKSDGDNGGSKHNLRWNMDYNDKKIFIQANVNGNYGNSTSRNISFSQQSGLLRQDLKNSNSADNSSPSIMGGIALSKKLKNVKNIFSVTASFSVNNTRGNQQISTNTLYYDKNTDAVLKDSLLKRDLNSKISNRRINFVLRYSLGLKKPKDSMGHQSLNFNYSGAAAWSENQVSTFVFGNRSDEVFFVDSLSTSFNSISFNQGLGINYNYGSRKMRYNIGFNASPNLLTNRDRRLGETTVNNTFNYSPSINFSRTITPGKILSLSYNGSNQNPTLSQLQPLRNAQSLQNILVGNPDLKPSFNHNLNTGFNYNHLKSGVSIQTAINAAVTQNEIMSHVTLLSDTLNSLKQVTRYENVNGNYQVSGNYVVHIPIKKNRYSIGYSGSLGFSNRAVIFNNQKTYGRGLNFSQRLNGNLSFKKISLTTQFSYSLTNNNSAGALLGSSEYQSIGIGQISAPAFFRTTTIGTSLRGNLNLQKLNVNAGINYNIRHNDAAADQVVRDNSDINMNLSGQMTIRKSYFVDFEATKRLNYGYVLSNSNPLLVNVGLGKRFLKDKSLQMKVSGNDLLGQGNNVSRTVSGNTIVDSRNRQQTRVFSLNLSYNLSRFGGRNFRVDPD